MASKIKGRIWDAYVACEQLCDNDRDAEAWLRRSFEEACKGEKMHRAMGRSFTNGQAGYKLPVADAARFFAVKWFLDFSKDPQDYADACALRPDCLYAYGARDRVRSRTDKIGAYQELRLEYADVSALDYSEVFAA